MKKKVFIIVLLSVLLVLLVPIPLRLKDGGSVKYKAFLYEVMDVKRLNFNSKTGYEEGFIIKILGVEIFNNVSYEPVKLVYGVDGVSMKIKEGSLTETKAVVIIEDLNKNKYVYGEEFFLEKKENDNWIRLTPNNYDYGFNEIGYVINEDNKLELIQDWSKIYGVLGKGKYRLVKNVFDNGYKYFFVEFDI